MSKLKLTVFFALFSIIFATAQEPLNHEKKVYISPDKKIFVNKALPIYFRVSTSPDPEAPSYVLKSERTPKYANPMYFDTEGFNSLRSPSAVDPVTKKVIAPKQDILFEVYADGIAPKTQVIFSGSKKVITKGVTYFGGEVKLEFKTSDATSGVEKTYVSLNKENYKELSAFNNSFSDENIYTLKYYSVDYVGNAEEPNTTMFSIDKTPPVTTFSILGANKGKALSAKSSVKLSSEDSLCGVDKVYYSLNDGPYQVYSVPIPISVFKSENSKISYYGVDKLGNKETAKLITMFTGKGAAGEDFNSSGFNYYIDRESPVISIEAVNDVYKGKLTFISERTQIKINAEDEKSGVDKIMYSIGNALLKNTYSEPFNLKGQGYHTVFYTASDFVGNSALPKSQQFLVDASIPSSKSAFSGNYFANRDTNFITGDTKIRINTIETGSGIKAVKYVIDSGNEEDYTEPITIKSEGIHVLKYHAIDNVNNTEEWKNITFFVDNIAPKIHCNFSVISIGEKSVRDEKYTIYPSNVMLYIAATDNASGGEKIEYKINGGAVALNKNPIKGLLPGNYEIDVTAWDVLKNKSHEVIKFAIEE